MVNFMLMIGADMNNVTYVEPQNGCDDPDFKYCFKLKCGHCGEVTEKETCLSLNDIHLSQKCKFCSKEGTVLMIPGQGKPLTNELAESGQYAPMMLFDCKGYEPVGFVFGSGWKVVSTEGTTCNVDLSAGEFTKPAEKGEGVMISNLCAKFDVVVNVGMVGELLNGTNDIKKLLTSLDPLSLLKLMSYITKHANLKENFEMQMFSSAYDQLYEKRWNQKQKNVGSESEQLYWEQHLQDCLGAVAQNSESLSHQFPSAAIAKKISTRKEDLSMTFRDHFCLFGPFARSLVIHGVLCTGKNFQLLQDLRSDLQAVEFKQVQCLNNVVASENVLSFVAEHHASLKKIGFSFSVLSDGFILGIFERLQTANIEYLFVRMSQFKGIGKDALPAGLEKFIQFGSLTKLCLSGVRFGMIQATSVLKIVAQSTISTLDMSYNNISGFFISYEKRADRIPLALVELTLMKCSLTFLEVQYIQVDKYKLLPKLEKLNTSQNLGDDAETILHKKKKLN